MTRYHPLLVSLHWLLALLIVASLAMGRFSLSAMENSDPDKLFALRAHMAVGIAILALMAFRLVVRMATAHPPLASTGNATLDTLGKWTHRAFYLFVIAMAGSGLTLSLLAGLPDIVFGGSGASLPADFSAYLPRAVHGVLAAVLALMIAGHVAALLFHQFGRRDRLLSRMWFGRRRD